MVFIRLSLLLAVLSGSSLAVFAQQSTDKRIIETTHAPAPAGPYSQAVAANGFLFVAGQVGLDPATRQLVTGGFEAEAVRVMENIKAILEASGLTFADVINTTIYLKDVGNFAKVNQIYGRYFSGNYPARTTVGAAGLPGNANVEIAVVAVLK